MSRKKYFIFSFLWTLAVVIGSNIPSSNLPTQIPKNTDVLIHLIWYGIMSYGWGKSLKNKNSVGLGIVFAGVVFIGILNECFQEVLSLGRSFEFSDLASNTVGALIGIVLLGKKST